MADSKITKEVYEAYAKKITSVLNGEGFYEKFNKRVHEGASLFKLGKKRLIQDIALDWIDTIEDVLPNLDNIVRNPRKFIVQEEDIVDVALARSISTESVKFLAQHTNMISKVDKDGSVTPSKILNISKEESFEIYENRFIYTLLLKLKDFVSMRYDKIKKATATLDVLEMDIESRFNLPSKKVTFKTEYMAQLSFDEVMRLDPDTLTKIERVSKMDRIITDFLSSPFAKSLRGAAPVRPPIMRTNVILKNPDFKKALTLWQFIENYQQTAGFSTSDEVEEYPIEDKNVERLKEMITLNTMLFESMYDQQETDLDMEDKEFADILKVGKMDFEKDKVERDEYGQKLDEEKEKENEEENTKDVAANVNEALDTDKSKDIAEKATEEATTEETKEVEAKANEDLMSDETKDVSVNKDQEADESVDLPPEIEIQYKEKIVEIEKIVEVEKEVEVEIEKLIEMPPKADQEEVDIDPDAETFDQHLFDVKKLYKRPDEDKVKQEDIIKVKDAIDRCLNSYRRIKQEEIDERDRQDRIKKRKEDIQKRAAAFKKQREELELLPLSEFNQSNFFGMDPFSFQKAKIAKLHQEEDIKKREKDIIKYVKDENLDFADKDIEGINKAIKDMELINAINKEKADQIDKNLDSTLDVFIPVTPKITKPSKPAKEKEVTIVNEDAAMPDLDEKEHTTYVPKYSKPYGKTKNIEKVDLNKVGVGDIHIAGIDNDPFASFINLGSLPKNQLDNALDNEEKEEDNQKPKKANSKKTEDTEQEVITLNLNEESNKIETQDENVEENTNTPIENTDENVDNTEDNSSNEDNGNDDNNNSSDGGVALSQDETEGESKDESETSQENKPTLSELSSSDMDDMMASFEDDLVQQKVDRAKAEAVWDKEQDKLDINNKLDDEYAIAPLNRKVKKDVKKDDKKPKTIETVYGVGGIHINGTNNNPFDDNPFIDSPF